MKTELFLPKTNFRTTDVNEIKNTLQKYGVEFTRWEADRKLHDDDTQETILEAYAHELKPYMQKYGYLTADVINVSKSTPDIEALRGKFLSEHTHSEHEIRFFVDGAGVFWFHFEDGTVARLNCVKNDFMSVPKGVKHWFDLAPYYHVKAIRIFSNKEGWVAQYTNSGVDLNYQDVK